MSPADVKKVQAIYTAYLKSEGRRTVLLPYSWAKHYSCNIAFGRTNLICLITVGDPRAAFDPVAKIRGYTEKFVAKRPDTCIVSFQVYRGVYDTYVRTLRKRLC